MPLVKSTLAQGLEQLFANQPAAVADAAATWANAYLGYAGSALSSAGSLPGTAAANSGILLGAFQAGLGAFAPPATAGAIAQGIVAFWQAIVWAGPTAAGATVFPGNASLAVTLAGIFADLSGKSAADKARELADAFDAGARTVIVSDVPFVQPAPPIVGPIR